MTTEVSASVASQASNEPRDYSQNQQNDANPQQEVKRFYKATHNGQNNGDSNYEQKKYVHALIVELLD